MRSSPRRNVHVRVLVLGAAACLTVAAGLVWQTKAPWTPAHPAEAPKDPSDLLSLVDQDELPFALHALHGRSVVLNFVFTHCQTSCPLQTQALIGVQRALPAALTPRVQFVSVTIDPERDTPRVLAQFAEAAGVRLDNWSFVTGHPQDIAWLHRHFGAQVKRSTGDQLDHRVAVILLDAQGQFAQKYVGDIDPERLAKEIGDVDRLTTTSRN